MGVPVPLDSVATLGAQPTNSPLPAAVDDGGALSAVEAVDASAKFPDVDLAATPVVTRFGLDLGASGFTLSVVRPDTGAVDLVLSGLANRKSPLLGMYRCSCGNECPLCFGAFQLCSRP